MLATTAFGVAGGTAIATCRSALAQSSERPSDPAARGQRFGAGVYNTDQVAEELRYIEGTVQRSAAVGAKRILITGSTAGVGQLAAAYLLRRGHLVVAHARNAQRASEVVRDLPGIEAVVVGDLINLDETRDLAEQVKRLGTFDVIVHNAGEYGLPDAQIINANSVSPYLLTALVDAPREAIVYLSSSLHTGGDLKLDTLRSGGTNVNYNDSKLHMATLATAIARRRPGLRVNAVRPGWVATLMGFHNGPHAPDDLRAGYMTQVWLSEGADPASDLTGRFLFHQQEERRVNPSVYDEAAQDALLDAYAARTGVELT
ncbi:SDR family NAD(P)-dependent oxidoreductase [Poseidonocella sp. HB161398]|uniref:SDR family NAD(P)-dependent oxidoreductase n=1 Tax=Poseidonocella sp. HB161398 TaxID=2320855 RepID=UPI001109C451|nr:SDR family NAD(P)-dependent oxidoreductase [Poseidonocella sp. HB161398]